MRGLLRTVRVKCYRDSDSESNGTTGVNVNFETTDRRNVEQKMKGLKRLGEEKCYIYILSRAQGKSALGARTLRYLGKEM